MTGKEKVKAMQKQNKKIFLYFPSASDIHPCFEKQGLNMHSSCLGRQEPS